MKQTIKKFKISLGTMGIMISSLANATDFQMINTMIKETLKQNIKIGGLLDFNGLNKKPSYKDLLSGVGAETSGSEVAGEKETTMSDVLEELKHSGKFGIDDDKSSQAACGRRCINK